MKAEISMTIYRGAPGTISRIPAKGWFYWLNWHGHLTLAPVFWTQGGAA